MISIRAFRAVDEEASCYRFLEEHQKMLNLYYEGVKVTSSTPDWIYNAGTIVVLVESEDQSKLYGGARIQMADGINPLPIETAISSKDPAIHRYVKQGSAEICGLWNSKEVSGMGIGSIILGRVTAAICGFLPLDTIYMLCAPVTVRMCSRVGCMIFTKVGKNGIFYYPKEDFIATAMVIPDPGELSHADLGERSKILALRLNPYQTIIEEGPKGSMSVTYNLEIPAITIADYYLA